MKTLPTPHRFTVTHRGIEYPVYGEDQVPAEQYSPITYKVYMDTEREVFDSMMDRLASEDCLLVDGTDVLGYSISIYRNKVELDPWKNGGYTGDGDGALRVAIGLRSGLKPELFARLVKDIPCFHT